MAKNAFEVPKALPIFHNDVYEPQHRLPLQRTVTAPTGLMMDQDQMKSRLNAIIKKGPRLQKARVSLVNATAVLT